MFVEKKKLAFFFSQGFRYHIDILVEFFYFRVMTKGDFSCIIIGVVNKVRYLIMKEIFFY